MSLNEDCSLRLLDLLRGRVVGRGKGRFGHELGGRGWRLAGSGWGWVGRRLGVDIDRSWEWRESGLEQEISQLLCKRHNIILNNGILKSNSSI